MAARKINDQDKQALWEAARLRRTLTTKALAKRFGISAGYVEWVIAQDPERAVPSADPRRKP